MNYLQYVNASFKSVIDSIDLFVSFGQNIASGSCLSGLTRGLHKDDKHLVINTPNIENTQVGVGFGLMLSGVSSAFFMKQQDFLLLGIDHLVNTYNFVRIREPRASFTIVTIVVDSGYEGIQSSLNNLSDICSIARIPGYAISNKHDADHVIGTQFPSRGFRIIGVSQRLFRTELIVLENDIITDNKNGICQYLFGKDATVVCFNFSFPQGLKLCRELETKGIEASLFSVSAALPVDWSSIMSNLNNTSKLVILDDGKCVNRSCYHLVTTAIQECTLSRVIVFGRECSDEDLRPNAEEFVVDIDLVMHKLF